MNKSKGNIIKLVCTIALSLIFIFVHQNVREINSPSIYLYLCLVTLSLISDRIFYRGQKSENHVVHRDTSRFLTVFWFTTLLVPIIEFIIYERINHIIAFIGIVLVILGIIVRVISIKTLGEYFSRDIEKWSNHRIVEIGIYKRIRHPAYLGNIVQIIGFPLILNSYLCLILSAATIMIFIWRLKVEEAFLKREFPEYKSYMKRTKRIIPHIW